MVLHLESGMMADDQGGSSSGGDAGDSSSQSPSSPDPTAPDPTPIDRSSIDHTETNSAASDPTAQDSAPATSTTQAPTVGGAESSGSWTDHELSRFSDSESDSAVSTPSQHLSEAENVASADAVSAAPQDDTASVSTGADDDGAFARMARFEADTKSIPNSAVDTVAADKAVDSVLSSPASDPLSQYTGMDSRSAPATPAASLSLAKVGTEVDDDTNVQAATFAMSGMDWGSFLQKKHVATPRLVTVRLHKSV